MLFGDPIEKTRDFILCCSINYPNPDILPPEQVIVANRIATFEFLQLACQLNLCYPLPN